MACRFQRFPNFGWSTRVTFDAFFVFQLSGITAFSLKLNARGLGASATSPVSSCPRGLSGQAWLPKPECGSLPALPLPHLLLDQHRPVQDVLRGENSFCCDMRCRRCAFGLCFGRCSRACHSLFRFRSSFTFYVASFVAIVVFNVPSTGWRRQGLVKVPVGIRQVPAGCGRSARVGLQTLPS